MHFTSRTWKEREIKLSFLKLISRKSFPAAVVCQKAIGKHFYAQIIVLVAIFAYVLEPLVYPGCSNFESCYCMYSPNNERNCFIWNHSRVYLWFILIAPKSLISWAWLRSNVIPTPSTYYLPPTPIELATLSQFHRSQKQLHYSFIYPSTCVFFGRYISWCFCSNRSSLVMTGIEATDNARCGLPKNMFKTKFSSHYKCLGGDVEFMIENACPCRLHLWRHECGIQQMFCYLFWPHTLLLTRIDATAHFNFPCAEPSVENAQKSSLYSWHACRRR